MGRRLQSTLPIVSDELKPRQANNELLRRNAFPQYCGPLSDMKVCGILCRANIDFKWLITAFELVLYNLAISL
jgi:hypothetical protein